MIRAAEIEDREALTRLEEELFGVDAWQPAVLAEEIGLESRQWTVITDDRGEVIGYGVLAVVDDVADLLRIGVRRDQQRRGVASDLLGYAVTTAQALGAERMLLEVSSRNEAARAFYKEHQFDEIDRRARYYRDGSDAVVLARDLLG